jgi:thiamine-monophosphate kinase
MREWELLEHVRRLSASQAREFPHVVVGPGDDCAVVQAPGHELLLKVDQVVEGRHFPSPGSWEQGSYPRGMTREAFLDLVARKAVARALSDIAACAGSPLAGLVAACVPERFPDEAAVALAGALHQWGRHWGCPIVGGDVASWEKADGLVVSVSIVGAPGARGIVARRGARVGDAVYVTGRLGGSLEADGLGRHMTFEPRLKEAAFLAERLGTGLHAMMDVSDGLGIDAARLGAASEVGIELEASRVPLNPGVDVTRAARDGEDYELLFVADDGVDVPARCPATGCEITRIGRVVEGNGAVLRMADGSVRDISRSGWEHA